MAKKIKLEKWPVLPGDYAIGSAQSPVAIVTLASDALALDKVAFAIMGPARTENLGIERIVMNVVANPNIRFVILCGSESRGHFTGQSIAALKKNGIDAKGRIIGAKGAFPYVENVPRDAVAIFLQQVEVMDRIGCIDAGEIAHAAAECAARDPGAFSDAPYVAVKVVEERAIDASPGDALALGCGVFFDPFSGVAYAEA